MNHDAFLASLPQTIPGVAFEPAPSIDRHATVYTPAADLHEVARTLRDLAGLGFAFLADLTATDFWPREPRFEVVYLLVSIAHRHRLRLKVRLNGGDPHLATVSDVWPAGCRGRWRRRSAACTTRCRSPSG